MWTPPVSRYMTPHPRVLSPDDKLSAVRILMHEHHVHHLPVVEDQILVGILSDRDLVLMNTFEDRVRDAMTRDVASVTKETPLDEKHHEKVVKAAWYIAKTRLNTLRAAAFSSASIR